MIRLLQILVLIFLAWLVIRFFKRLRQPKPKPPARPAPKAVDMLPCAYCGEHIPEPEAITKNGKAYCSQAHLEADR